MIVLGHCSPGDLNLNSSITRDLNWMQSVAQIALSHQTNRFSFIFSFQDHAMTHIISGQGQLKQIEVEWCSRCIARQTTHPPPTAPVSKKRLRSRDLNRRWYCTEKNFSVFYNSSKPTHGSDVNGISNCLWLHVIRITTSRLIDDIEVATGTKVLQSILNAWFADVKREKSCNK